MRSIFRHKLFLGSLFSLLLLVFIYLAVIVYNHKTFEIDEHVFEWSRVYESGFFNTVAVFCTFFGSQTFLLPANILLIAIFVFRKKLRAYAWKIAVVTATSASFLYMVKFIIKRPRPATAMASDFSVAYSFPSGHAFTSLTFFGIIAYFAATYIQNKLLKNAVIIICVLMVICIGWSRVYLHVHYPTDVIGGFCLGTMWLIMAKWFLVVEKAKDPTITPH
jgi:undecaprenyl-diphosphatase